MEIKLNSLALYSCKHSLTCVPYHVIDSRLKFDHFVIFPAILKYSSKIQMQSQNGVFEAQNQSINKENADSINLYIVIVQYILCNCSFENLFV